MNRKSANLDFRVYFYRSVKSLDGSRRMIMVLIY